MAVPFGRTGALLLLLACVPVALASDRLDFPAFAHADAEIAVDGALDEAVWSRIDALPADFRIVEPPTLAEPAYRTDLKVFTTERGIYVGTISEQPLDTHVRRLTSRDTRISRDNIGITFDTSGEGRYGYWFNVALGDSLSDGTVLPERQYSNEWNGPWQGRSKAHENHWTAEFFIPWSMLSMPATAESRRQMQIYVTRFISHVDQRVGWPPRPNTEPRFMSDLQPVTAEAVSTGQQFTFYPYASANYDGRDDDKLLKSGAELFWRPLRNVQVSSTFKPDFGSVETDDVVVNLSAFEVFFRERRPFFLEDQSIFETSPRARSDNGRLRTTLLNTRRIGGSPIEPDLPDGQEIDDVQLEQPTDLLGAVKVTGNTGRLRYGVFTAFEDDTDLDAFDGDDPFRVTQTGRDFAALRVLYEDSRGDGYRQLGGLTTVVEHPDLQAIVQGIDAHWLGLGGALKADGQLVASHVDEDDDSRTGFGGHLDLRYQPEPGLVHEVLLTAYDEELDYNDFGFLRRNDVYGAQYNFELTDTDIAGVRRRVSALQVIQEFNGSGRLISAGVFTSREWLFDNLTRAEVNLGWRPARWDDRNSQGNGSFKVPHRGRVSVFWGSNPARPIALEFRGELNQEDLGDPRMELGAQINYRPVGNLALELELAHQIRQDWLVYQEERDFTTFDARFWQPRVSADYFLTARQQLRFSLQWTGIKARSTGFWAVPDADGDLVPRAPGADSDDFNRSDYAIQVRYRWEFAPLSDLALVYTRAARLRTEFDASADFPRLFNESLDSPDVDLLVLRLRYRLGT